MHPNLSLQHTTFVRPGRLIPRPGSDRIVLDMPADMLKATFEPPERYKDHPRSARNAATLERVGPLHFETYVADALLDNLREMGHADIADLGDTGIGQQYKLVIVPVPGQDPEAAFELHLQPLAQSPSDTGPVDGSSSIRLGGIDAAWMKAYLTAIAAEARSGLSKLSDQLTDAQIEEWLTPVARKLVRWAKTPAMHLWLDNRSASSKNTAQFAMGGAEIRLAVSHEFHHHIAQLGMVYGADENLAGHYYLALLENGRLFVKYQSIIGSRQIGVLSPAQQERLQDKINAVILAHNESQAESQAQATKEATAPSRAASLPAVKPTANPAVPAVTTDDSVLTELSLLRAEGNKIILPAQHLSQYDEIKARMENAGFKYRNVKKVMFFEGAAQVDAAAVLAELQSGARINIQQETQFFATPPERARLACAQLGDINDMDVLEPSAGDGALADEARSSGARVTTVENWDVNVAALRAKGYDPVARDFLEVRPRDFDKAFDAVLLNPPFTKGQDMKHVQHALSFLKPTGRLCAITSGGAGDGQTSAHKQFAKVLEVADARREAIPAGEFKSSGTGVATSQIFISMPALLQGLRERGLTPDALGLELTNSWPTGDSDSSSDQDSEAPRERARA